MPYDMSVYDLIVIGGGAAAAYYLSGLDKGEYREILVITMDNPWDVGEHGDKGRGGNPEFPGDIINFINHTEQMCMPLGSELPAFSTELVKRLEFSKETDKTIKSVATWMISEKVNALRKVADDSGHFEVECQVFVYNAWNTRRYRGRKIVVATGAGSHRVPSDREVAGLPAAVRDHNNVVMDMDKFGRDVHGGQSSGAGKTVVILGPNAAIDTADTTMRRGFKVVWLFRKGGTKPQMLPTLHQEGALKLYDGTAKTFKESLAREYTTLAVGPVSGQKVSVKIDGEPAFEADYFIFGYGQDDTKAREFFQEMLNQIGGEPIYDKNQRFGNPWETVIGFQTKGTTRSSGVEFVGSITASLQKANIEHNYLDQQWSQLIRRNYELLGEILQTMRQDPGSGSIIDGSGFPTDLKATGQNWSSTIDLRKQAESLRTLAGHFPKLKPKLDALAVMVDNCANAKDYFQQSQDAMKRQGSKVSPGDIDNSARLLTATVVDKGQLGTIRAQTASINAQVPKYVHTAKGTSGVVLGDTNISSDDQTMIRIWAALYVSTHFPLLDTKENDGRVEKVCSEFIQDLMNKRKARREEKGNPAWGFTDQEKQELFKKLYSDLASLHKKEIGELSTPILHTL